MPPGPSPQRALYHRAVASQANPAHLSPALPLTQLTDCGGCAAKLGADLLERALAGLDAAPAPPNLLAGLAPPEDAAVYRLTPDLAVVATVDFFPPLVDDPETYGAIAAANACSDVFAVGGQVLLALSVAAFPEELPTETMGAILQGAARVVAEAGGVLAGGHTIRDREPKYGLAVVGVAHPQRLLRKAGARPGDVLLLTKPLGTGLLISGHRQGTVPQAALAAAITWMRRLNRPAAQVFLQHGVRAATDVTGFGLLGHAAEMVRASRQDGLTPVRFALQADALPALDGALEAARRGVETAGAAHNRRAVADLLEVADGVTPERVVLAFDPQTSGGLLAAVPPEELAAVEDDLAAAGVTAWEVGRVEEGFGLILC